MKQVVSPMPEELAVVGSCCAAFNVRKASRVITRLYAEALAPVGVEPTQFMLLVACARQGTVTMGALAVRMSMDPSALARNVSILARRGLVRIAPGADRRVRDISISASGRQVLSRALPRWREVQAKLAQRFGEDSFRSAVELMKGIARTGEALLDHPLS
ncbi:MULTISPECIES: MarR family winged helix-turn-helix transcriptional regulator [unclassified Bradyrhizobium]|uniref:MarR family winged helix-turn-helix transcriptional regulator n=1 Tax=unclassified Bradyrhizobium TaxID=2631580 RepID=UPI001BA7A277|nr:MULTISPECIES: MarR family transcriptional regulator [unclassified Bradyrhizobium]MBR1208502.1 MarR family transcriptional regulator [Bradyrhizobium sp. AUGA SZCCT0124]MBR1312629.1 MarR family transcriptional regulator [Bradyrhizobium sp. AUGA SZCCT0051]MBR1340987.1 MarR family transcriptional regulator [Bradyrhizobium sp. AUGA SZCCT0105]MBR1359741.1 MarR family transcriptional regulator [Bradyrhizobium sp. AUGA SZCCT0045]